VVQILLSDVGHVGVGAPIVYAVVVVETVLRMDEVWYVVVTGIAYSVVVTT